MFSFKKASMRKLVKGKHAERSSFLERKDKGRKLRLLSV